MPYEVLEDIRESMFSEVAHSTIIDSAVRRLRLYIGHLHRSIVQERRIAVQFQTMAGQLTRTSEIVTMEYKIKFEPIRYRESLLELYGKGVISWYGAVVLYRR